jgi:parallel beta-helix repeat protein
MRRKVVAVWVGLLIMISSIAILVEIAERVEAPYIPHDPFRIDNDAEFVSMAGSEGWAGNGLPGSPYIIEGYDINGSGYGYCIYIGNTTVHFEVKDSYLHEANGHVVSTYVKNSGILMYYVQNGTISNNTISNNVYGIYLYSSDGNTIVNNIASRNSEIGLTFTYSSSNAIGNNTSTKNFLGMTLHTSHSNKIANNTVSSNNGWGIHVYSSINNKTTQSPRITILVSLSILQVAILSETTLPRTTELVLALVAPPVATKLQTTLPPQTLMMASTSVPPITIFLQTTQYL